MNKYYWKAKELRESGWEYLDISLGYLLDVLYNLPMELKKAGPTCTYSVYDPWQSGHGAINWFKSPIEGIKLKDIIEIVKKQEDLRPDEKKEFMKHILTLPAGEIRSLMVLTKLKK